MNFDLITNGQWQEETPMPVPRTVFAAEGVKDQIYVMGGLENVQEAYATNTLLIYDINTKQWRYGPSMEKNRLAPTSAAWNNKVYVMGGAENAQDGKWENVLEVEIFDTVTETWSKGAPMPAGQRYTSSVIVDGKVYIIGGTAVLSEIMIYDMQKDEWLESVPTAVNIAERPVLAVVGQTIYIFALANDYTDIYAFNTVTKSFNAVAPLPYTRSNGYTFTQVNGIVYKTGPHNSGSLGKAFVIYGAMGELLAEGPDLPVELADHRSVYLNNCLYVLGGRQTGGVVRSGVNSIVVADRRLNILLEEEEDARLIVTNRLQDNPKYDWQSTDVATATASQEGRVAALEEGLTEIVVQSPDGSYSDDVGVKVIPKPEGERLALYLKPGEVKALYLEDDYQNIVWTSEDSNIAEVDGLGIVTGISRGLTEITAEYSNELYSIYVRVE